MRFTSMRFTWAAISLLGCVGSVAAQQMAQAPFADVDLPYSACGDMAVLKPNINSCVFAVVSGEHEVSIR